MQSRIQASETLIVASRFTVERVDYRLGNGRLASKEVVRHPGAVVIVPILPDGRLCLIKNYRVAVDQEMIELPAGTLEPNESPETTAHRELIEETGYRCGKLQALCRLFMSPGILNEQMHAFLATDLSEGQPDRECGEEIVNLLVEPEEALDLLKNQVITDSKTVSVLLYYFRFACEANRVSANL